MKIPQSDTEMDKKVFKVFTFLCFCVFDLVRGIQCSENSKVNFRCRQSFCEE